MIRLHWLTYADSVWVRSTNPKACAPRVSRANRAAKPDVATEDRPETGSCGGCHEDLKENWISSWQHCFRFTLIWNLNTEGEEEE